MLTKEEIISNKEEFLSILQTVQSVDTSKLVEYLEESDFFIAPASIKYHASYEGGLCLHSLNVYYNLLKLVETKNLTDKISSDSIIITSLLHDISKSNFYLKTVKDKKVYNQDGTFEWIPETSFKVRDNIFIYGNHEENSEFMLRMFIPLTLEQSVAILNHMGGESWDSTKINLSTVYAEYPLVLLLHLADMLATFLDEVDNA